MDARSSVRLVLALIGFAFLVLRLDLNLRFNSVLRLDSRLDLNLRFNADLKLRFNADLNLRFNLDFFTAGQSLSMAEHRPALP